MPRAISVMLAFSTAASAQFTPAPGSPFKVGATPLVVAVGDLNGDGRPDLAITGDTLTVLLGNGAGGFTAAPGSPFTVGRSTNSVAVGDFNGDGRPDLAILGYNDAFEYTVTVLLGSGAGGFTAAPGSPFKLGSSSYNFAVADFNGDGKPDLAIASTNGGSSTVTVMLGTGTGGFNPAPGSPFKVADFANGLVVGDFNRDGRPDLAISHDFSSNLTVLLGTGAGGFTAAPGSPFTVGYRPYHLAVGDFNGDGRPDLAVGNFGDDSVTVLLGTGTGGFTAAPGSPFKAGSSPSSVAVGDFNGDGKLDLAIANDFSTNLTVLLGTGTGGFNPAPGSPFTVGSTPSSVAVGDFNSDGRPDLAIASYNGGTVTVLLNSFPGFPTPKPAISQGGVADALNYQVGAASATFLALFGQNLSATTRTWDSAIQNNRLPMTLDGVSVTINGKSAAIFSISPGQVNILTPVDSSLGPVPVVLTNANGASSPLIVNKTAYLPAFYAPFASNGKLYATVVQSTTGQILGTPGVDPRAVRPVQPGELILLYGTGFGQTFPESPMDQLGAVLQLGTNPIIQFGQVQASFAGNGYMVTPGFVQFNLTVPDLPDGDYQLTANLGGVTSSTKVYISVKR